MGRKSSLTAEQWVEVERRHVVEGESINSLAAEYGVNESSIRRKIKPNKAESPNRQNPLQALALDKVILAELAEIDAKSIRPLREGEAARVAELAEQAAALRAQLRK